MKLRSILETNLTDVNKSDVYDKVITVTDAGPFDGGCVYYAFGLQRVIGGRVVSLINAKGIAQHAAVLKDNKLHDYDGSNAPDKFISEFNDKEMSNTKSYRDFNNKDLPDAIRGSEEEIIELANLIRN